MTAKKPSQRDWEITLNVLDSFLDHTKETEPYAVNLISPLESLAFQMPSEVDEAWGDA